MCTPGIGRSPSPMCSRSTSSTSIGDRTATPATSPQRLSGVRRRHHRPALRWGAPVLSQSKVTVEDLVALWRSGERLVTIADEYDLTVDVVEDVLRRAS